ncbi:MAG: ABC transporter substrate-binding protein, partial [Spirochaetales bacterium]|nr:ABC transporter substrate-binding protein [Spirochaetales bacterium]
PHLCTDAHAVLALRKLMFQSLLVHDGMEASPLLSKSWEQTDNGRRWIFQLQQGITFPDGREMTARDAVYSLKRAASAAIQGQLYTVTYHEYFGGAEIRATDAYTVELVNPEPLSCLEELLSDLVILPEGWTSPADGTGTGPYILDGHDSSGVHLSLRKDMNHPRPLPLKLIFQEEKDALRRVNRVRAGDASLALDPPISEVSVYSASPNLRCIGWDTSLSVIFFIRCDLPPLDNPVVRQALNLAVDTRSLIETIAHGQAKPLNGPFSDRHLARDPDLQPYPFNPEEARRLLKQEGLEDAMSLEVHAPTTIPAEGPALAESLAKYFRQIGIDARVYLHEDRKEYARAIAEKELPGVCCFDSSPSSSYKVLREKLDSSFAGTWWQGYHNGEVNNLIAKASNTVDPTLRREALRQAYRILHHEAPWVFLYQPKRFYLAGTGGDKVLSIDNLGYFVL